MSNDERPFSDTDREKVVERYTQRYAEFGYSEESLGWGKKGRQQLRFEILSSYWNVTGKRILDLGAGFGDLFQFLHDKEIKSYFGIELTPALVKEGHTKYHSDPRFHLSVGDVSDPASYPECDIAIISGLFNFKLESGNNYRFIEQTLRAALTRSTSGCAANFITDRVDYTEELIFNANPETILKIGLGITKSIAMRFDYMPFEFSLFLNKHESFDPAVAVFDSMRGDKRG